MTKRSFIPGYEDDRNESAASSGAADDAPPWAAIGVGLGLAVVGGGYLVARSRRRDEYEPEEA